MTEMIFELPEGGSSIIELLFVYPNQYTDGMYMNFWLGGFFMVFLIGSMYRQVRPSLKESSLYASFGTFIVALMMTLASTYLEAQIVGENQLIPVTILLIGTIVWNYFGNEEVQL